MRRMLRSPWLNLLTASRMISSTSRRCVSNLSHPEDHLQPGVRAREDLDQRCNPWTNPGLHLPLSLGRGCSPLYQAHPVHSQELIVILMWCCKWFKWFCNRHLIWDRRGKQWRSRRMRISDWYCSIHRMQEIRIIWNRRHLRLTQSLIMLRLRQQMATLFFLETNHRQVWVSSKTTEEMEALSKTLWALIQMQTYKAISNLS